MPDLSELERKTAALRAQLSRLAPVVVAFSGGVDSGVLAYVAHDVTGDDMLAVTARSESYPMRELEFARAFCAKHGIPHAEIDSGELDVDGFADNPPDRCYLCKRELFGRLRALADARGYRTLLDGSNADDLGDSRPGMRAARQAGVVSPLLELDFTKDDIRALARQLGLTVLAEKPSFACLASRFPTGQRITADALAAIEAAEDYLHDLGLRQLRVRVHATEGVTTSAAVGTGDGGAGMLARIETDAAGMDLLSDPATRTAAAEKLHALGFRWVALDLTGYRTGSMNL
ncbi:MAG: ATP-dependent sacrificial sulfur transferase LarE [Actinomycetes bacterium]|nr:ATP-dependent sacrificial sulfur transferase LarE [Actinomycetes bacterium]